MMLLRVLGVGLVVVFSTVSNGYAVEYVCIPAATITAYFDAVAKPQGAVFLSQTGLMEKLADKEQKLSMVVQHVFDAYEKYCESCAAGRRGYAASSLVLLFDGASLSPRGILRGLFAKQPVLLKKAVPMLDFLELRSKL